MPPIVQQPRERSLHHPPMRDDPKALAVMLHNLRVNFMGSLQAPDPRAQPFRAVPAIDPELPQACHPSSKIAVQQGHQALPIIDMVRRHHYGDDQPKRVDQHMTLAAFNLSMPVKPDFLALGGGLDTLAVDRACGRLGEAPLAPALNVT